MYKNVKPDVISEAEICYIDNENDINEVIWIIFIKHS